MSGAGRAGFAVPSGASELVSAEAIAAAYDRVAPRLQSLLDQDNCVLLAVMNGGLYPLMELLRRLRGDFLYDYCHASRYRGSRVGGSLDWVRRPPACVKGRTVILLDDIFDLGITLQAVAEACIETGAARVYRFVQVIKDTPARHSMPEPDFTLDIRVPDRYVFGCGMDLDGRWRHLPAIYALDGDVP